MKKDKITLISLYDYKAIGIRRIYAAFKKNGYDPFIVFLKRDCMLPSKIKLPSKKEFEMVLNFLKENDIKLVGVSLNTPFFSLAKKLTEKIKKELNIPVIWGGIHPTTSPEQSIKISDAICIGEGDESAVKLADYFLRRDTKNINNTWIKENDKIIKNKFNQKFKDLNIFPFIEYSDENKVVIEDKKLKRYDPITKYFTLYIIISRGCKFNCSFCTNSVLKKIFPEKYRERTVKNVINEIIYAKKYFNRISEIKFLDENFPNETGWLKNFVKEYKNRINLPFFINLHPNLIDEECILLLKSAGLKNVVEGIQSGSERIRQNVYNEFEKNDMIIKASRILRKYKIRVDYSLIFDNPLEKKEDKKETLELMLKLSRPFNIDFHSLTYFPNTDLTNKFLKEKIIREIDLSSDVILKKYGFTFEYPRSNEDTFYTALISLASKRFVPKSIIQLLEKSKYLEKNPQNLLFFVRFCNKIKILYRGVIAVLNERVSKQFLKDQISSFRNRII